MPIPEKFKLEVKDQQGKVLTTIEQIELALKNKESVIFTAHDSNSKQCDFKIMRITEQRRVLVMS